MIYDEQIVATNLYSPFVINVSSLGFSLAFLYLEISDSPADNLNSEREKKKLKTPKRLEGCQRINISQNGKHLLHCKTVRSVGLPVSQPPKQRVFRLLNCGSG